MIRPTEDLALAAITRAETMRHNLASLRTDFEEFIVLLSAIGWGRNELAQLLGEHEGELGYTRSNMSLIVCRGVRGFEVNE